MDTLVRALHEASPYPPVVEGRRYSSPGSSSHLDHCLTLLGYPCTQDGITSLQTTIRKYTRDHALPENADRIFSFETGRWAQQKSTAKVHVSTTLKLRATTPDLLRAQVELVTKYLEHTPGAPTAYPVSTPTASPRVPAECMTKILLGEPCGDGAFKSEVCTIRGKTAGQVTRMEAELSSTLIAILAPNDPAYVKDIGQMVKALRTSYQRYHETATENEGKVFSVHTHRWGAGKGKGLVVDTARCLYARDKLALELYIMYMLPASSTPAKRLPSLPLPSETEIVIPGPPAGDESGLRPAKSWLSARDESGLRPAKSWAKVRVELWFYEQERLKSWGCPSYFEGKNGRCFACLKPVTFDDSGYEACHIWPRSRGGTDTPDNLRVGCAECNRGRGGMHTMHGYEWLFVNKMPGLAIIPHNDKDFVIGELLHREYLLLLALVEDRKLTPSKEVGSKLKLSTPVDVRLATAWAIFRQVLPKLENIVIPRVVTADRVDVASGDKGCTIM